ncbi:MAG: UDP-glucuronic acid decarboxylase family protein [Planctomycetota bacterium]|nr:UDP-glucuronic acid decarboxylase family protein [Planctomycetota bacterium]
MRVVITGGAGFIGSHLCDRYINENHEVLCLDNFITGSKTNITQLMQNPKFTLIECDISDGLPVDGPVDRILHMASPASPIGYLSNPLLTLRAGSLGTFHALDLARKHDARILLASTSEIYGDPKVHPQTEDYWGNVNPIGLRSVYDEAKRFSESVVMCYHRQYGVQTRIVRIFNTYGPRMQANDGRALPTFLSQALAGEPLTVFGDGKQTRSFCFVSDLVEGLCRLLESSFTEPVNLGNPDEITVIELAREICDLVDQASDIRFETLPQDDPQLRRPDISRAQDILDWNPTVTRQEGIARTLDHFRQVLQHTPSSL